MPLEDYNIDGYVIRVTEEAFMQLCLAGLEAYCVPHRKSKRRVENGLETYGTLWGHECRLPNGKTFYGVEYASVDTSAEREPNRCGARPGALELKRSIISSSFPQYSFLGDFHTHPHETTREVRQRQCYTPSFEDYISIEDDPYWLENDYKVGLILTIVMLQRQQRTTWRRVSSSTVEGTMGYFRLWLHGTVAYLDEDYNIEASRADDKDVTLECSGIGT